MGASCMTGQRSWRFQTGDGRFVEMASTDFRLKFSTDTNGGQGLLKLSLVAVWEHADFTTIGLARRQYMETRLQVLAWSSLYNCVGQLLIDGTAVNAPQSGAMRFKGIQLGGDDRANDLMIYQVDFESPLLGCDFLSRYLSFTADQGETFAGFIAQPGNFLCYWDKEDKTVFTDVFRAAPVRIRSGPGLRPLKITAIHQQQGVPAESTETFHVASTTDNSVTLLAAPSAPILAGDSLTFADGSGAYAGISFPVASWNADTLTIVFATITFTLVAFTPGVGTAGTLTRNGGILRRRQNLEATLKLISGCKGCMGTLNVDGESFLAHLKNVTPNFDLPDTLLYDLEFTTGFAKA